MAYRLFQGPQWGGYVSLAGAVVLPLDAWANVTALSAFDSANSMTNSLYWIATRPQQGILVPGPQKHGHRDVGVGQSIYFSLRFHFLFFGIPVGVLASATSPG